MDINTTCVHGAFDKNNTTLSLAVPIYQSATFSHPTFGQSSGYDYSRLSNPTRDSLERLVASLENGKASLAFSSGMAAIAALMELFQPNDHIVACNDLYGGSIRLFKNISMKNGLDFDFNDFLDLDEVEKLIRPETKAFFVETPTNPMMNVCDIQAIGKICKKHNILLIVDNTFLTPILINPLDLGADIVIHSGTKFLCGHNDVLAGFLVLNDEKLIEKLKYIHVTVGNCLAPFDCYLVIRGIKTLSIRLKKQEENAMIIAEYLSKHPKVKKVYYNGLKDNEGYEISKKQARGFGSMLSFRTNSYETTKAFLNGTNIILFAESLGGTETLVTFPMTQTHADLSNEERTKKGIDETLLRLSVGIEDVNDLIKDLDEALK
ncbi:MAG: trans-sulfuration enzyme family protein [Lachnospirales bacterium]